MRSIARIAAIAQRPSAHQLISALIAALFTIDLLARHAVGV